MRVLFLSLGGPTEACSRTRIFALEPYLKRAGVGHRIVSFAGGWRPPPGPLRRGSREHLREVHNTLAKGLRIAWLAPQFDVVVVQRVLFPPPLQRLIRGRSRALLFDIDDAIWLPHYTAVDLTAETREARRFDAMVKQCDGVIASTPYLADRVAGLTPRIWTIITPVDTNRYRPANRGPADPTTIGWIGSPSTAGYLEPLGETVASLLDERPTVRCVVIGAPSALAGVQRVERVDWRLETEATALQRIDIGLMPLPDDAWTRGKAGYKLLQYMAVGAASIASPVGVNPNIVREGVNGYLADLPTEWRDALNRLIDDSARRRAMGANGRAIAEAEYSLDHLAPQFIEAFRAVSQLR